MLHIAQERGDDEGIKAQRAALDALWRVYDHLVNL